MTNDDYQKLDIELSDEQIKGLVHGESVIHEFSTESGHTLAVDVQAADRDLDKDWILGKVKGDIPEPNFAKTLAALLATWTGISLAVFYDFTTASMLGGGVLSLMGAIVLIEQINDGYRHAEPCVQDGR